MESAIKKTRYFWTLVAGAALCLVLLAQPAHAAGTKYWVGPNPNVLWTNPNNWSNTAGGPPGAGQPISGDEVNLTQHQQQDRGLRHHLKSAACRHDH